MAAFSIDKSGQSPLNRMSRYRIVPALAAALLIVGACSNPWSTPRAPRKSTDRAPAERPIDVAKPKERPRTVARRSTRASRRSAVRPRPVASTRSSRVARTDPPGLRLTKPPARRSAPITRSAPEEASPVAPAANAEPAPAAPPGSTRVYYVQPNDTLWSLAKRFYGDSKHWRRILAANRNRVPDPTSLPVGIKLIIP